MAEWKRSWPVTWCDGSGDRAPNFFETTAGAWWLETGSTSSMCRFFIHIDAQDAQDIQDHRLSWLLVQETLVGLILCILCIPIRAYSWFVFFGGRPFFLEGSAQQIGGRTGLEHRCFALYDPPRHGERGSR